MVQKRNHRLSDWLYHTRFYGSMAGRFALEVLWDAFQTNFLSRIPDGGTLLEVGSGSELDVHFSLDGSMFELMYQKNEVPSTTDDGNIFIYKGDANIRTC